MAYRAKILLDSLAPSGKRLVTFELEYARLVHSELLTHRLLSRNSSSSRAIPIQKMIQQVLQDPVIPVWWGRHQKGMQASEEVQGWRRWLCERIWRGSRYLAVAAAWLLWKLGMHKQIPNRLLEPWMWITIICSATEFGNFFNLRCHPDAQPEIRKIADMMAELYYSHEPTYREAGEWHLPLTGFPGDEALDEETLRKLSVARSARVSYLTHDGRRDIQADLTLYDRLLSSGHMSPFEHVAQAMSAPVESGNFTGWQQYRKVIPNEHRASYFPVNGHERTREPSHSGGGR